MSQLSQQGRQPVGPLALLFELLQGLFFLQALLFSPLVFLLSPWAASVRRRWCFSDAMLSTGVSSSVTRHGYRGRGRLLYLP
jgi:hypothetical protein